MGKFEKLRNKLLYGSAKNFSLDDAFYLARHYSWKERNDGTSHHVFTHEGRKEIINLQDDGNGKAKIYQIKQMRTILMQQEEDEKEDK